MEFIKDFQEIFSSLNGDNIGEFGNKTFTVEELTKELKLNTKTIYDNKINSEREKRLECICNSPIVILSNYFKRIYIDSNYSLSELVEDFAPGIYNLNLYVQDVPVWVSNVTIWKKENIKFPQILFQTDNTKEIKWNSRFDKSIKYNGYSKIELIEKINIKEFYTRVSPQINLFIENTLEKIKDYEKEYEEKVDIIENIEFNDGILNYNEENNDYGGEFIESVVVLKKRVITTDNQFASMVSNIQFNGNV